MTNRFERKSGPSAKCGRPIAFFAILVAAGCSDSEVHSVEALQRQLAGDHCRFDHVADRGCFNREAGVWQWLLLEPHHCDIAAVECLAEINTPEAHEVLVGVLMTKANVQTCDGRYPVRTRTVEALGDSSYKAAIESLIAYRDSGPIERLSSGASGCEASPEQLDAVEKALKRLLSRQ